jgi:hypothetical protein
MQADEEHGAIGDLAGQLGHARPGCQEVDRSGRRGAVAQPRLGRLEAHGLPGEKAPNGDDGLAHDGKAGAGPPDAPCREEAWRDGQTDPAGGDLLEALRGRGEEQGMPHDGARRRRVEPGDARALGGDGEGHVHIAAAVRVVVHADPVEAGVLAPRDKIRGLQYRQPDRHADVDLQRRSAARLGACHAN